MRPLILIFIFVCFPIVLQAQFCTGTLSENIFTEGDFGTGTANLLSPNPNIAPGYNYTFNVPPLDGNYVLTNNTASWAGLFPSWLAIGDNSADPNGYMMVVNASNAPGLFYEQTVSGLCENTLYEFSADIINLIKIGTPDHLDPHVSFLLNNVELFSTGNISKTNDWTTYGFTFTTEPAQESLTLSLRNNAPGGNGNDLALDNISFRACGPEVLISPAAAVINVCEGDTPPQFQATITGSQYASPVFQWQESTDGGTTWIDIVGANQLTYSPPALTTGMYLYRLLLAAGVDNLTASKCRVNSEIKIINVPASEFMQSDTICQGLTLEVGSSAYSVSGVYEDIFTSFFGCDSILTTNLTVLDGMDLAAELLITSPCENLQNGSILVESISGGTPPFNYIFEGMDEGTTNFFDNLMGGETYSLIIEDAIGCSLELTPQLENLSNLSLDLGENQTIELGETLLISPDYNFIPADFSWQTLAPIDCQVFDDCSELSLTPTESQTVLLTLITQEGCTVSDSIFIEVTEARRVWFCNAFSPNGDGVNDFFTVLGENANIQIVEEMRVFNRWGSLVFEGKNFSPNAPQSAWDGTFNGNPLPLGVYIYTVKVRFADGEVLPYSGNVSVVR